MSNLIEEYYNDNVFISIDEAKLRISELSCSIRGNKSYYRCNPNILLLTQKERYEILLEREIQYEIDYYESQILKAEKEEEEIVNETHLRIDCLEDKLDVVQNSVYQIIGGIFNQHTQKKIMDEHINELYQTPSDKIDYTGDSYKESIYPTTRQGDANEAEIKLLKQQVSKLEETVNMLLEILKAK